MLNFLDRYKNQAYALLRIVSGFLFLFHGSQKLLGFPGSPPDGIPDFIIYVAGPIELIGGILIMIGLFTREAAFLCSGLMAAGYFMAHATVALFPILNRGELAIMFSFTYLFIACTGGGIWSVDRLRSTTQDDSVGSSG
jgi:putative oxidoreductase